MQLLSPGRRVSSSITFWRRDGSSVWSSGRMLAKSSSWGHSENRKSFCSSSLWELRLKKNFPSVVKKPSKSSIIQPYCHGLGHLPLDQLLTGCRILNLLLKLCSFAPRPAYSFYRRRFLLPQASTGISGYTPVQGTDLAVQRQNLLQGGTELLLAVQFSRFQ